MFNGHSPKGYQLEPLEGITWTAGNTTEEIETSVCAITDYLGNHIPTIISTLAQEHHKDLIKQITAFNTQFTAAVSRSQNNTGVPKWCHRNVTTSNDYMKKRTGLRILYFSRKWVEHFANATCV